MSTLSNKLCCVHSVFHVLGGLLGDIVQATVTNDPRMGGLNKSLFLTVLDGGKFKVEVPTDGVQVPVGLSQGGQKSGSRLSCGSFMGINTLIN